MYRYNLACFILLHTLLHTIPRGKIRVATRYTIRAEPPVSLLFVLLFTFRSAGMPFLPILVIDGCIWICFSISVFTDTPLFFMSYLVVSSIQMGTNINCAIGIASRCQKIKTSCRTALFRWKNGYFRYPAHIHGSLRAQFFHAIIEEKRR